MKKFLLVALLLGLCVGIGQAQAVQAVQAQPATDCVHGAIVNPSPTRDTGDMIYEWSPELLTGDIRCLGVAFDGTDWWVTGANDMLGAYLYRFSYGQVLLNSYAQGNTGWGWRDLCWDGTYLYASDSYTIEQINPATGGTTGVTYTSPVSPARALAYDDARDCFWTASFSSPIYKVPRSGSSTSYTTILAGAYGAAYDAPTDKVWFWDQTSGSGVNAHEFDPATGTWTGETWDGNTGLAGIAGGACIFEDPNYGHVFAGLQQAAPDTVSVYELGYDPNPQVDIKVNGEDAGVVINDGENATMTIKVEARGSAGLNTDIFVLVKNDAGRRWCFNLANDRWYKGWCYEYVTGPLTDYTDTVLDMSLPIGGYDAWLAIDTVPNGNLDKGSVLVYDYVDFEVVGYTPPLYDNGDTDGTNGYFYSMDYSPGLTVTCLDDFVIPGGETWTITGFNDLALNTGYTTSGFYIDFLQDAGGAPGTSVGLAANVAVSEVVTGRTWFGYPEIDHVVTFDPVVLGAGTYWVEFAPYLGGGFSYVMIRPVVGYESWWHDTGVFGGYYGPVGPYFGVSTDYSFKLQGTN